MLRIGADYHYDTTAQAPSLSFDFDLRFIFDINTIIQVEEPLKVLLSDMKLSLLPEVDFHPGKAEGLSLPLGSGVVVNIGIFTAVCTEIGFGVEENEKYLSLTLDKIQLPGGLGFEGSLRGLRLYYDQFPLFTSMSLSGLRIKFETPGVLSFEGAFAYDSTQDLIAGALSLHIIAAGLKGTGALAISPQAFFIGIGK